MKEKNVFISYSSTDNWLAEHVAKVVSEAGMVYWKAPEMIPAGSNYAKEIPKAIQNCDIFLLLISKASQESIWVEKEIDSAINYHKMIVPVRIDKEPLNEMYRFYLNNVQMISYSDDWKQMLERLRQLLKKIGEGDSEEKIRASETFSKEVFCKEKFVREDDTDMELQKESIRRRNAFTENKAPVECDDCKAAVKEIARGVYRCVNCGKESYDYLQTVRRYLEEKGAANVAVIEKETKVPRTAINSFLKEGYLEIRK